MVEIDDEGNVVRSASAADASVNEGLIWPYSLAVIPEADRVVVTSFVMGFPDWVTLPPGSWPLSRINNTDTQHIQVWSLSSLKLLSTIELPISPDGKHEQNPAEPRVLTDNSVFVNTFNCGLYHIHSLNDKRPTAHFVLSFPGGDLNKGPCGIPVVVGKFWVQTVSALPGLIALDISNPENPVEVSRLKFEKRFQHPHWIAADRRGARLVVTGSMESWILIVNIDPRSGRLTVDEKFRRNRLGIPSLKPRSHMALLHGALFGMR